METIAIKHRFAGANIRVVSQADGLVRLEQEIRDSGDWWFYWRFAARSAVAQTVVFTFDNGEVVGPYGPAVSSDGMNWTWLAAGRLSPQSFQYTFKEGESVHFGFSIPYQVHDFESFYARLAGRPGVSRQVLCLSEQLRAVPLLQIGGEKAAWHVVLTCRHHACESTANYVAEGILNWVFAHPDSGLSRNCRFHVVPFIDIDGVENGDQGKHRLPHDHNRDYAGTGRYRYRTTEALERYVRQLPANYIGIDLHCPFKWGGLNDIPFVVKRREPLKSRMETFSARLEETTGRRAESDAIRYFRSNDLEHGSDWNVNITADCASMHERAGAFLCFSFEVPYFGVPVPYSIGSLRRFGSDFAEALDAYVSVDI
ncbi:hypothetical protein [Paenibacillus flagellatus]|uniref:Peptidase M14 carboxypeptidase A domain-containing protein n=1 Tax=Paenibacillus flagellatus TaxID=2211139 RepID=A0A2V5KZH4_9BACL|nr:hypothetical protein [Paenibacillus flagellatus]PYI55536.1 hypothetical protein DLM86_07325 [Paenibacillus flagellatus]